MVKESHISIYDVWYYVGHVFLHRFWLFTLGLLYHCFRCFMPRVLQNVLCILQYRSAVCPMMQDMWFFHACSCILIKFFWPSVWICTWPKLSPLWWSIRFCDMIQFTLTSFSLPITHILCLSICLHEALHVLSHTHHHFVHWKLPLYRQGVLSFRVGSERLFGQQICTPK